MSLYTDKDYFCGNLRGPPNHEQDGDPDKSQRGQSKQKQGNRVKTEVDGDGRIRYTTQNYGMGRHGRIHNKNQIDNEGVHNGKSSVKGNRVPNQQSSD